MRESTWRKIDKIYMTKRRRALAQTYRGDPTDPANAARIARAEFIGVDTPTNPPRWTAGVLYLLSRTPKPRQERNWRRWWS